VSKVLVRPTDLDDTQNHELTCANSSPLKTYIGRYSAYIAKCPEASLVLVRDKTAKDGINVERRLICG
jgi:hypothetical protein